MKKFLNLFLLLIFVTSCGYKNINLEGENDLNISQIILVGNKKIGRILQSEILLISSSQGSDKIEINLSSCFINIPFVKLYYIYSILNYNSDVNKKK